MCLEGLRVCLFLACLEWSFVCFESSLVCFWSSRFFVCLLACLDYLFACLFGVLVSRFVCLYVLWALIFSSFFCVLRFSIVFVCCLYVCSCFSGVGHV